MLENIEALAADTESGGEKLVCYSKSTVKQGATYIDCNTCCKTYNEKAKGDESKCKGSNPPCEKS